MLKKLELDARDIVLAGIEAGLAGLGTALVSSGGKLEVGALVAAGVIALRAAVGLLANKVGATSA